MVGYVGRCVFAWIVTSKDLSTSLEMTKTPYVISTERSEWRNLSEWMYGELYWMVYVCKTIGFERSLHCTLRHPTDRFGRDDKGRVYVIIFGIEMKK